MWRKTLGRERNFYQGLIQVAAALVHVQRGNPKGAEDLYGKALKHLGPYSSQHQGVDLDKIIRDTRKSLDISADFPKIQLAPP